MNEAILFEMEKKENGRLPLLDVMVSREGVTLTSSIYRKGTHTDWLLDYNSCHPVAHKRSVVKTLWSRAEKVCSVGESEVAARLLRKHGVEVTHKPRNTLHGALTKVKDTESQADRIGVVYDVKCKDCEIHYVGETGKKLATRLQEHQRAVDLINECFAGHSGVWTLGLPVA
ncbi:uncharacterized protein LOC143028733 [Oratosquilla oratoria]|uniref:uncharacterized protein LOC143028733 n=1 Tax=Oratosquilla oratoria TaxID=337810 RepID=UPI003F76F23B